MQRPSSAPNKDQLQGTYGWIFSLALLGMLSVLPFLLTASESLPRWANPKPVVPQEVHPVSKVIFILVDGLGYKKSQERNSMPYLQRYLPKTAHGIALASFPTVTGPGIRAIMSGHRIINFGEFPGGIQSAGEIDSVLFRASAGGLKAYAIGQQDWDTLFSKHGANLTIYPYAGPYKRDYDVRIYERAKEIVEKEPWDMLAVHFFGTDPLGHMYGIHSPVYNNELLNVDRMIFQLWKAAGPKATIILAADHGQLDNGNHGGLDTQVRQVPCVIWGHAVKPGKLQKIYDLHDFSQTMSVLLGIPPPVLAEGYPIYEALDLTTKQKSLSLIHLLEQRYQRWIALHDVWPTAGNDPAPEIKSLWKLWKSGQYDQAQKLAETSIKRTDHALEWFSRSRWVARLIFAVWFLVFASCFGLAWPRTSELVLPFYIAWITIFLVQLPLPIFFPGSWPVVSFITLLGSAGIFIFSLLSNLQTSNMNGGAWLAWILAAGGLLCSDVIDVPIWSWAIVWGIVAWRAVRFTYADTFPLALSLAALLACAAISPWSPVYETSFIRSILPLGGWGRGTHLSWSLIEFILFFSICGVSIYRWRTTHAAKWIRYSILSLIPLIAAFISAHFKATTPEWTWILCAASFVFAYGTRITVEGRAHWLSIICLAFYRTLSHTLPWCFLSLAALTGWGLGWKEKKVHALSDGMGILGLVLLSYSLTGGGRLDLSHISVEEGYRALGMSWQPHALVIVIVLKNVSAIAAAILPWLAGRSILTATGVIPMLGALAAGNLTYLWLNRYGNTLSQQIQVIEELPFVRLIWATLFAWIILALWCVVHTELVWRTIKNWIRYLAKKIIPAHTLTLMGKLLRQDHKISTPKTI